MDDVALAAREHENFVAAFVLATSHIEGAVVRRQDGVALIATGLPIRLFNQVVIDGDDATPAAIAAAVAVTRRRGDLFMVFLRRDVDDRFVPVMADLGLVPVSDEPWTPGMALHPIPAGRPAVPPGHEIRRVVDRGGLEEHIRVAVAGFGMDETSLRAFMDPRLLGRSEAGIYVGYTDGVPVTSGLGIRTGRTIGIYSIATVESARRRGYGAAMTARIAADAAAGGCDVAILQASEMGLSTYTRLGYRTVVEYVGYEEPPADGAGETARDGHRGP